MTFGGSLVVGTLCVSDCSKCFHPLPSYHWTCLLLQKLLFGLFVSAESRSGMISKATMASAHYCMVKKSCHFYTTKPQMVLLSNYVLWIWPLSFPNSVLCLFSKGNFCVCRWFIGNLFLNAAAALGMLVKSQVSLQLWNDTIQPQDSKQ